MSDQADNPYASPVASPAAPSSRRSQLAALMAALMVGGLTCLLLVASWEAVIWVAGPAMLDRWPIVIWTGSLVTGVLAFLVSRRLLR
jgi:hypothetical protein